MHFMVLFFLNLYFVIWEVCIEADSSLHPRTAQLSERKHTYLKNYTGVGGNFVGISSGSVRIFRFTEQSAHLSSLHGQHSDIPGLQDLSCQITFTGYVLRLANNWTEKDFLELHLKPFTP